MFGERLATPVGVAAGPHTQLAQTIVIAWLTGSRVLERMKLNLPTLGPECVRWHLGRLGYQEVTVPDAPPPSAGGPVERGARGALHPHQGDALEDLLAMIIVWPKVCSPLAVLPKEEGTASALRS